MREIPHLQSGAREISGQCMQREAMHEMAAYGSYLSSKHTRAM
jgi:hypothetical protein